MALALQSVPRRSSRDGPVDGEADVAKPSLRRPRHAFGNRHLLAFRKNQFSELVERTVDALKSNLVEASLQDVQNVLAKIRRQFDEVRCEADRKEAELVTLRQEIRFWESEAKPPEEQDHYNGFVRKSVVEKLGQASTELDQALETQKVYQHMVERLLREQRILEQKVLMMENYLDRQTREVEAKQHFSRRINEDKVEQIVKLEMLEQDMDLERTVRTAAMSDLSAAVERRRHDVNEAEYFETWRYEAALEAATEAFEATAGRYRKIYAIEKLTGNCLQRLTFDQAEQSQATEDGFQRIREVTGLTDVMEIVQKFLHREDEHEQLKTTVREAEARLQLREEEASRPCEDALVDAKPETRGLGVEVTEFEQMLEDVRQDHSDVQEQLKQSTLLVDSLKRWSNRLAKSLAPIQEIKAVQAESDLPRFFNQLVQVVHEFLDRAHAEMPDARLVKITSEATHKDFSDQGKLLHDKDFLRSNCRVATAEPVKDDRQKKKDEERDQEEEKRGVIEFATDRERVKKEAADRDQRFPRAKVAARGRARDRKSVV